MSEALGMIECRSFPAMVEAADAMVKAAKVELVSYEKTGGGAIPVMMIGDYVLKGFSEQQIEAALALLRQDNGPD